MFTAVGRYVESDAKTIAVASYHWAEPITATFNDKRALKVYVHYQQIGVTR